MENNLKEKLFYNIGEVAEAFNVNPSLIRYWEKEFEILNPKKTLRGTRKYNSVDIKNLKLIYNLLKNRGFTIEGAKEKIKSSSINSITKSSIVSTHCFSNRKGFCWF